MEKENEFLSSFFNPSWDSVDPTGGDFFESALSSMVSSPTTSNTVGNGEHIVLRELIGRLGGICNNSSGEISPHPYNFSNSVDNSCYSTPLHSPPRLNLSTMMEDYNHQITGNVNLNNQQYSSSAPFSTDPGFAEETAKFSSFANKKLGGFSSQLGSCSRVLSSSHHRRHHRDNNKDGRVSASDKRLNSRIMDLSGDQRDMSTVSEQIPVRIEARNDSKKRKASARGKGKENPSVSTQARDVPSENSEPSTKRIKSEDGENEKDHKSDANEKKSKGNSKPTEPPKDYIHVRARRGQATDAHSLAERVRREKISERMKFLQDLVPGCNKVTGKAVMLDEIINYVQSLQLQVEFLSMKLANVNPETVFHMEDNSVASKEMFTSHGVSVQLHNPYASDSDYHHCLQAQADLYNALNNGTEPFSHDNTFNAALGRNQLPPHLDVPTLWGEDLHSVVPM